MTVPIVEFLETRLAEIDAAARAADTEVGGTWTYTDGIMWGTWPGETRTRKGGEIWATRIGSAEPAASEHAVLHDPARVLREVAAKRAILDEHSAFTSIWWPDVEAIEVECCRTCSGPEHDKDENVEQPCPTLRALAAVYSDHPDYREEWSA